jgi:TRAP transporter TAXI family solute receptor
MKARHIGILLYTAVFLCFLTRSAQAAEPNWPASMSIATASPGGTYHAYGAALAKILTRVLGISVAEQPTEGPSQNIQLMESGWPQIGFVTLGVALEGWNGSATWTNGRQFRSMQALFPMYDSPFTFAVAKSSAIRSLTDMAGKRMGVGPHGGTAGDYIPKFLAVLKLEANLVYGSYDELAAQLQTGKIDILAAAAGAPFPALAELDAKKLVRFIGLGKNEIVALRLAIPELTPSTIPAGSYPSLMADYQTVGLFNFAVVHKSLPIAWFMLSSMRSSRTMRSL